MARLPEHEIKRLTAAIQEHDYLRRVVEEIERLHRVVFHGNTRADWRLARPSAEQILIAEIVVRHCGQIDGVYFALRKLEDAGQSWDDAVRGLSVGVHSYFTTPLGIIMRQDMFGSGAVFITPDALDWVQSQRSVAAADDGGES